MSSFCTSEDCLLSWPDLLNATLRYWGMLAAGLLVLCSGLGHSMESRAQFSEELISQPCTACSPSSIHVADLDNDSDLDVLFSTGATFYPGDGKLAWYESKSDGFSEQNVITTRVSSFETADLDGDGDEDIVASAIGSSSEDDRVVWYENLDNGGISSTPRTITRLIENPDLIRTDDLDGDEDEDIFLVSRDRDRIFWLENKASGFSNPKAVGKTSGSVLLSADVDGDRDRDILSSHDGDLVSYENTSSGFASQQTILSDVDVNNLFAADLDGDDDEDLLTTSYSGGVVWYENQDAGDFSSTQNVVTSNGKNPTEVVAADLDGDNDKDVLYSSESGDKIAWHENLDDEGISRTENRITADAQAALSVAAADLDGDNDKDVLSASANDDKIAWYRNQLDEDQRFETEGAINELPDLYEPQSIFAADLDGDSDKDVLTASEGDDKIAWYRNLNSGGFSSQTVITTDATGAQSVYAADLDGDGDKDVLSASSRAIAWYENVGRHRDIFSERVVISTDVESVRSVYAADLDGDSDQDILTASLFDDKIAWYENQDAGFSSQKPITTNADRALVVDAADFDGDDDKDVLSASEGDKKIAWYENHNSGGFSSGNVLTSSADGIQDVLATDLDGDGDKDVLYAAQYDKIGWFENLDSGGLSSQVNSIETFEDATIEDNLPQSVFATDLDGDSDKDVLAIFDNTIVWYENLDSGEFSSRKLITSQVKGGTSVFAANLDQDFDVDVLASSRFNHKVAWYENTIGPTRPSAPSGLTATASESATVELAWDAANSDTPQNYRIYRSTAPFSGSPDDFTPLESVDDGRTRYTDEAGVGRTYYYRLTVVDDNGTESGFSNPGSALVYPQEVTASFSRTFDESTASTDYRLVALPGQVDRPLGDAVSGQAGIDWQAYYDDGSDDEYLVGYDESDTFHFQPGNGFWLTSTADWTVEDSISTVPLRGDSAAVIGLQDGWNVISNPFEKDVLWRRLNAATSDALQPIWAFDGTFTRADTFRSATDGVAYYFFNDDPARDSLTIPYPNAPILNKTATASDDSTRMLAVTATSAREEAPHSTVHIGLSPSADRGVGNEDLVAPPDEFSAANLRLKAPGDSESKRRRALMTERRPPPQTGGHTFRLQLTSRSEARVRLSVDGLTAMEDRSVALLHPSAGRTYDLRRKSAVMIEPTEETTALRVAIGADDYVESRADEISPKSVQLTAYPNPMGQQGTLEYTLPEQQKVSLQIYDVLGREVATLEQGRKQAGRHTVELGTERLSSGIYFGRLTTGNRTLTQKISILR